MEEFEKVPLGDGTPSAPIAPDLESRTDTAPDAPELADAPQIADAIVTPETPQLSDAVITSDASQVVDLVKPETPQVADVTEASDAPQIADAVESPEITDAAPVISDVPPIVPDGAPSDNVAPAVPDVPPSDTVPRPRPTPSRVRRPRKQRRRWLWGFLCGVAVAGLLAVGARIWERHASRSAPDRFVWDFHESDDAQTQNLEIQIPTWPVGLGAAFEISRESGQTQSAQDIYRNVNPSVVTVIVGLDKDTAAVGTGVIFTTDGYFVTNYHVIQGGSECRAMLDSGRSYPALYVAGDDKNDLAVLKMDADGPFPAAQFGDSEILTVGDPVYAIGNPLGIEFRGTLTDGIVSAIDRDVLVDGRTMTLIQTNAALNSGNSGGPLINEYGQVVGINVVKMSSRRSTVEGLGFAIPSASMERLVNDLLTYGENQPEPVIGVSVDSFGTEIEPDLWGIGVLTVERESAAERAGIEIGDYIIGADGETISSSRDLLRIRRRYHIGESMSLTLWRNGERLEVSVTFAE